MSGENKKSLFRKRNFAIVLTLALLIYFFYPNSKKNLSEDPSIADIGNRINQVYGDERSARKTASLPNRANPPGNHAPPPRYNAPPQHNIRYDEPPPSRDDEPPAEMTEEELEEQKYAKEEEATRVAKRKADQNQNRLTGQPDKEEEKVKSDIEKKFEESVNPSSDSSPKSGSQIESSNIGNGASTENSQEEEGTEGGSGFTPNQAPTIIADNETISVREEANASIEITGNDPENIYLSFSFVSLPPFITSTRTGNQLDLDINPLFGDKGTYNFQVVASDDQGLSSSIDIEVTVTTYVYVVKKLQLVDSNTDTILGDLTDNQTIDLDIVGDKLNIVADVPFAESVKFDSSDLYTNTEDLVPFAYRGDIAGDYSDWTPTVGPLTIVVTPYELDAAGGTAGTPYTINLNFIDSNP